MNDLTDVRALTLHPPWSWAITHAGKTVENRSWMPPESVDQIMIHAGKTWDWSAVTFMRNLGIEVPSYGVVSSAIVAVVDISYACDSQRRGYHCDCNRWAMRSQCHWNLANGRVLQNPVGCNGRQRLWIPSPSIVDAVRADLLTVANTREEAS